jgi:hypothetical protein
MALDNTEIRAGFAIQTARPGVFEVAYRLNLTVVVT